MSEQLNDDEIKLLKLFINKPIIMRMLVDYPRAIIKDGLFDQAYKVCKFYGIDLELLIGKKRDRYLVQARRDFCLLTKKNTKNSFGLLLQRELTMVIHYLKDQPHNIDKINGE